MDAFPDGGGGGGVVPNVAIIFLSVFIIIVHDPVPEQAPLHPWNVFPDVAVAVRVTEVPDVYDSLQSDPQEIPVGLEATVPEPVLETESE